MAKLNFDGLIDDIKRKGAKEIENQISDNIRKKFPEITNFTVKFDIDKKNLNITGLTPEQIEQVKHK